MAIAEINPTRSSHFPKELEWEGYMESVPYILHNRAEMDPEAYKSTFAEPLAAISRQLKVAFPAKRAALSGFDLQAKLANLPGPVVEVGGPTSVYEAPLLGLDTIAELGPKTYVTNFHPEQPGTLDMRVDARRMPFKSESLGAIAASYLYVPASGAETIDESNRVLHPGGLLMYQGLTEAVLYYALSEGFEMNAYRRYRHGGWIADILKANNSQLWNVVLKKPHSDSTKES